MGLETELEFRKGRGEGFSPNTVLPYPRHCSDLEKRNAKGKSKPARKDNKLNLKEDFRREISFGRYRSSSCKNAPSSPRPVRGFEGNVELKRGSIYQSSREVSHMKRTSRIDVPRGSDSGLNFRVVDSLCGSDEPCPSDDFFEICFDSNVGGERVCPKNDGNDLIEKATPLPENDRKTRSSPIRKMLRKSLLDDFSRSPDLEPGEDPRIAARESRRSLVADSPVHLHGRLKLENKDGMPRFEFSSRRPEDFLVAKTWKADNASNWVYTFHSVNNNRNKESPMSGQMQVSCYLDERGLEHSMVTEFVLYGVARPRKSTDSSKTDKGSTMKDMAKVNPQPKQVLDSKESDFSLGSCPLAHSELLPNLEIAATVIQVPIEKRESLKCKRGAEKIDSNLLKLSNMNPKGRVADSSSSTKVKVVIPSGNHGMPSDETRGPSPLLDRWRLGGGCDCGGWDMACPLVVFGNPDLGSGEDHLLLVENQRPLELFVQGSKENAPALTLSFIKEGEYAVDFHAQLSTLQAFSISVAILHSTEASRNTQLPRCSSLKMLIEEEVKFLIESVTKDEKTRTTRTLKETFVLNPPFSPIARV